MTTKDFKEVLSRLVGTSNVLSNNVLFIDFCEGSHGKAQFLSQLFYWQTRTTRKDGFFFKTYDEWYKEIRLPKHSVARYANSFKKSGFLKTKTQKANGFPTVHYQLDVEKLIALLVAFCNNGLEQIATIDSDNLQLSKDSDNLQLSTNIEYHRIQTKNTKQTPNGEKDLFSKVIGLKEKIGEQHYKLINQLCSSDIKAYETLRGLFLDGRFELFTDWLEYKKARRNEHYKTTKGLKAVVNMFSNYTPLEMKEAVERALVANSQGLFPKRTPEKVQTSQFHFMQRSGRG